jgi:hypothetical protein
MQSKGIVVAYIAFIGLPILALLAILDAGHHLTAPVAVSGLWDLQADWRPWTSAPCTVWTESAGKQVLEVSQSGEYLDLAIDQLRGSGTLEPGRVTATVSRVMKPNICQSGEVSVSMQASLESDSADVMNGTLWLNGCASCMAVPFRAVHRKETKGGAEL